MINAKLKTTLSFIFFAIFIYFFYLYLNENSDIINLLKEIPLISVLIFFILNLFSYTIKALLNIYLFKSLEIDLSFKEAFYLVYMNTLGNLLGPLKAGSAYKLQYFYKKYKLQVSKFISLNTSYAILSIFLNFLLIILILPLTGIESSLISVFNSGVLILLTTFIFFLLFKITISSEQYFNSTMLKNFTTGFNSLLTYKNNFVKLGLITLIQIIFSTYCIYYSFEIFAFDISFLNSLFYTAIGSFSGVVKITPGNIGFYEVLMIWSQNLHGVITSQIIISSVFIRLVSYLSLFALSIYYFLIKLLKS